MLYKKKKKKKKKKKNTRQANKWRANEWIDNSSLTIVNSKLKLMQIWKSGNIFVFT